MRIVKLGGSLLKSSQLLPWLKLIQQCETPDICVVPGGSIFADAVRAGQKTYQYPDHTAHQMALLAMTQYACLCQSLCPDYQIVNSVDEIQQTHQQGLLALMNPFHWPGIDALDANWSVTSDSIAAWLATETRADQLILVKALSTIPNYQNISELSTKGILDGAFPAMADTLNCPIHILPATSQSVFLQLVND